MALKKISEIYKDGKKTYLVFAQNGRIYSMVGKTHMCLRRMYGRVALGEQKPLFITWKELEQLNHLLKYWENERDNWSAFSEGGSLRWMGGSTCYSYWPPKKPPITLGSCSRLLGTTFCWKGKDKTINHAKPRIFKEGIIETGEIWHVGEKVGNPKGEMTAKLFCIAEDLKVKLTRHAADLTREIKDSNIIRENVKYPEGEYYVQIEPGEEEFLRQIFSLKADSAGLVSAELPEVDIEESFGDID